MNNFKDIFGYFIFITLIFIIISIILIKSDNNIIYIEYIYIFIVIFGSYVINISSYSGLNEKNRLTVLLYTLLPWIIIFIGVYILLKVYSNWITPFSNTIGYIFVNNILGLSRTFKKLINDIPTDSKGDGDEKQNKIIEAIANFYNNYEILLNSLNPDDYDGFKKFFKDFYEAKILNDQANINDDNDSENIKNIKQLLKIKDFIGKICWFILAGTLSISVMNNSMNDI